MNENTARDTVTALLSAHAGERQQFDEIHAYLQPWDAEEAAKRLYVDRGGKNYKRHAEIARMSQTPVLGLILDTYGQSLKVDGFYTSDGAKASAWEWWQRNKMPARQTGLHHSALAYGTAYAMVLPAQQNTARISIHSPRKMTTFYGDQIGLPGSAAVTDEFPMLALEFAHNHLRLIDEEYVYYFGVENTPQDPLMWRDASYYGMANLPLIERRPHNLGVVPVVRYVDKMMPDGEASQGIIRHLINLQDRINMTGYEQGTAQYWGAFKQRYVTGWMPEDEREAFKQSVADTQFFDDPDVKVGQYDETDLTRYIESKQATMRDLAAMGQVPAQSLGANAISNISAEGLASLETSRDRKSGELQTSFAESHEQLLRLTSYVTGDEDGAADFESEVNWAETSARSFAQTVDGLGKMATMLGIPAEELWSDIPGWTKERVERTLNARALPAGDGLIMDDDWDLPDEPEPSPAVAIASADDPEMIAKAADALGKMIRAGVDPASAAAKVGLSGLQFTGATPVALRPPNE